MSFQGQIAAGPAAAGTATDAVSARCSVTGPNKMASPVVRTLRLTPRLSLWPLENCKTRFAGTLLVAVCPLRVVNLW